MTLHDRCNVVKSYCTYNTNGRIYLFNCLKITDCQLKFKCIGSLSIEPGKTCRHIRACRFLEDSSRLIVAKIIERLVSRRRGTHLEYVCTCNCVPKRKLDTKRLRWTTVERENTSTIDFLSINLKRCKLFYRMKINNCK